MQGVWLRDYTPMEQRHDASQETLGDVKPSNAFRRRAAGYTKS